MGACRSRYVEGRMPEMEKGAPPIDDAPPKLGLCTYTASQPRRVLPVTKMQMQDYTHPLPTSTAPLDPVERAFRGLVEAAKALARSRHVVPEKPRGSPVREKAPLHVDPRRKVPLFIQIEKATMYPEDFDDKRAYSIIKRHYKTAAKHVIGRYILRLRFIAWEHSSGHSNRAIAKHSQRDESTIREHLKAEKWGGIWSKIERWMRAWNKCGVLFRTHRWRGALGELPIGSSMEVEGAGSLFDTGAGADGLSGRAPPGENHTSPSADVSRAQGSYQQLLFDVPRCTYYQNADH